MRNTWLVTRRELNALLTTPLYFVLTGVFFLVTGYVFLTLLATFAQDAARDAAGMSSNVTYSVIRETFFTLHFFLLIQVPLLTMRSFSEDKVIGMMDLLQTTPLSDQALVMGKFLAHWLGFGFYIALGLIFPASVWMIGDVDWPVVFSCFAALMLAAGAYTAVGVFFSSLTESQVVAAVFSYVFLFFLVLAGAMADVFGVGPLQDASRHFTVNEHLNSFLRGQVNPMNIVYFFSVSAIFLFFTMRVMEGRRWKA